jgi:hypothetical protein
MGRRNLHYEGYDVKISYARKCLHGYMKEKYGRRDGFSKKATIDFAAERGIKIPKGMSPAEWLKQLYLSGEDDIINENGPYSYSAKRREEIESYRQYIIRNGGTPKF